MARATRRVVATRLFVVEGESEEALCKALREMAGRGTGHKCTIRCAHGGGFAGLKRVALKELKAAAFDDVVLVYDLDLGIPERLPKLGRTTCRQVEARDCLEAEVLRFLGEPVQADTRACKNELQKKHQLDQASRCDRRIWLQKLHEVGLDVVGRRSPWMKQLLELFGIESG